MRQPNELTRLLRGMRAGDGTARTRGLDPAWRVQDAAQYPFHPETVAMAVRREYAAYTAPGVATLIPKTRAELKAALVAHQQEIARLRRCLEGVSGCATCEVCLGAARLTLASAPDLDRAWRGDARISGTARGRSWPSGRKSSECGSSRSQMPRARSLKSTPER